MMRTIFTAVMALALATEILAVDWPTYRADPARSGYTAQPLPEKPIRLWRQKEPHAPAPAWPTSQRMLYDRACRLVIADGRLCYGTSADDQVICRDAATGQPCWSFLTDGPVRFAPAIWKGHVYVGSDDGWLYCLDAANGKQQWRQRGRPRDERLLGNDRMISRWPVRGGPVVQNNLVYFAAGIWPSEGIFLRAMDAATGTELWHNDSSGSLEINQPHPTAHATSGTAAQGHLVLANNTILMPTGRAVPAAFDLQDGKFRYFQLQSNSPKGGSEAIAFDRYFFNGGALFATEDGAALVNLGTKTGKKDDAVLHSEIAHVEIATHPRWIFYSNENRLTAIDRKKPFKPQTATTDRTGKKITTQKLSTPVWSIQLPVPAITALIVAGDSVIVGAENRIVVLAAESGQTRWESDVQGVVYDLAAADGRLYASTDQGVIECFGSGPAVPLETPTVQTAPEESSPTVEARAAEEILRRTGITSGYCLDLACGQGRLALELARRSKLQIYAVDSSPENVQIARQLLTKAGFYGVRVTVHLADPATVPYPNYFADLIVSGRSVTEGAGVVPAQAANRLLRPYGGTLCLGQPESMKISTRDSLPGAGSWTHQYADAANTLCSADSRLHSPLTVLWFRDVDLPMPSRHGRSPAPLVDQGRMIVEGLNSLRAVNIYNGTTFWEVPLPKSLSAYHQDHLTGVAATGSNICLGNGRVFLQTGDECHVLDIRTGQSLARWKTPDRPDGKPGTWGYLAYDHGLIFGSLADEGHRVKESWRAFLGKLDMSQLRSESVALFALDAETGQRKWSFQPRYSIRHNAIAVGGGHVYLIDRPLALEDTPGIRPKTAKDESPAARLICLDAQSGKVVWETSENVFGTLLILAESQDRLLMSYQPTTFKLDSELGGKMALFKASDGSRLWEIEAKYKSRPILNNNAIYAEPGKWDLATGNALPFDFSRSYGCGILASCQQLLVFRSATLGYFDLKNQQGTKNYGGIRPGCWINAIPAGGLILMADAASWCTCSYLNQAMIALEPAPGTVP